MRLDEGVIRELHWHTEAEWAYVLAGKVRITALDVEGGSFMDDLEEGDLWYFPAGHPHSLQGLSPNGTEFLLIFDDGNFSEESTFLLTDWLGVFFPHYIQMERWTADNRSTYIQISPRRKLPSPTRSVQDHPQIREIYLPRIKSRIHQSGEAPWFQEVAMPVYP
jgi:oxalate decarboxylase family bicupin protein